ncbi:MAG: cyanophycinase [Euryarchaeota archaeon]|nr:cyanophycinase [Euryarchaeota archaeon]
MKGRIFLIGGHLELVPYNPIIQEIEELLDGDILVIISLASANPVKSAKTYSFIFNTFGINVKVIDSSDRGAMNDKKYVDILKNSGGVFFTGGNQMRLTSILGGTKVHEIIKERLSDNDFVVIGTSAGATAIPETMIAYGSSEEALLKGAVKLAPGLGLRGDIIVDTHFISRNRIWRLLHVVAENPSLRGIGLSENTGIFIENDYGKVLGEGPVVVVDGTGITYTNIPDVGDGEPFSIKGITINILTHGDYCELR